VSILRSGNDMHNDIRYKQKRIYGKVESEEESESKSENDESYLGEDDSP
jgi:hypothetical protein